MTFYKAAGQALILVLLCEIAQARTFVSDKVNLAPSPVDFSVCYDHTCKTVQQVSITPKQWQTVNQTFHPPAKTAEQERQQIAGAIALMEQLVGRLTGTHNDKGSNLAGLSANGHQMDCIDESTNTTTYLTMLSQANKLKWHRVEDPVTRGFFIFGWPHTTAVIYAPSTKKLWAVDSWFYDNGAKPAIVPMNLWKDGWDPNSK